MKGWVVPAIWAFLFLLVLAITAPLWQLGIDNILDASTDNFSDIIISGFFAVLCILVAISVVWYAGKPQLERYY